MVRDLVACLRECAYLKALRPLNILRRSRKIFIRIRENIFALQKYFWLRQNIFVQNRKIAIFDLGS